MPGSHWLYLKIYAPRVGVNRLLLRLRPLLGKRYSGRKIAQWFFIRYEDHAPHIRLRLQIEPDSVNELLMAFKGKLEDRIQQHVIREFQLDVYSRELERYAAGGIENTERFFWASSELVLHFLRQQKNRASENTPAFAIYSTYTILAVFVTDLDRQLAFALESFRLFLPEFDGAQITPDLDKKYRELAPKISEAFRSDDPGLLSGSSIAGKRFQRSLQAIRATWLKRVDPNYVRSIIHMHLNRIFTDESRKQEMICYYLLYKHLRSVKGRSKPR